VRSLLGAIDVVPTLTMIVALLVFTVTGLIGITYADIKDPLSKPTAPKLSCKTVREWVCTAAPGGGGKLTNCQWVTTQECTVVRSTAPVKK
jgi:hypothetical protein